MKKILGLSYKTFFLMDGIGAVITSLMLAVILTSLQSYFGVPTDILKVLATIAASFALYSFSCYLFLWRNEKYFLRAIALANSSYCIITGFIVFKLWCGLTTLGIIYFIGEIGLVLSIAMLEWKRTTLR